MGELIALPVWLLGGLALFAVVGFADRVVLPIGRALLAVRRERVLAAINERLALPIAPYKLAGRRALVAQLMLDPAVQAAISAEARVTGEDIRAVEKRARHYAREIVPAFSASVYFRVGTRLARKLSTALYRVRVGASDIAALQQIEPGAAVVFVINHRSNMDYVLVTYLAARSSALSYAVGEWARAPGLAQLIRLMGGYFIRRGSGNQLYRRVLARYVHIATASGVAQAVFPEGGLSRDGLLQPAKLGLLAYMVADFEPTGPRDIAFVPVGLNYDRVLEDRVLLAAGATARAGERPRFAFRLTTFLGFAARTIGGRLLGRWYRNGYACVSFGKPLSLRRHLSESGVDYRTLSEAERNARIAALSAVLMEEVGRAVPALPVSLVAAALLEAGRPLTTLDLKLVVANLMIRLRTAGAQVYVPRADEEYAVEVGLRILVLRRLVVDEAGVIAIAEGQDAVVRYYANAIAHNLAPGNAVLPPTWGILTPPSVGVVPAQPDNSGRDHRPAPAPSRS